MPDLFFSPVVGLAVAGMLVALAFEALLTPRPRLRRPLSSVLLHAGSWLFALGALYALTGRPWFSTVNVLCVWLLVVLVSNAKYHSLREPFVCADFEYFSDAVRFPRLYLPFFGIGKAIVLALAFMAYLGCGLYFEPRASNSFAVAGVLLISAVALLSAGCRRLPTASFNANEDLQRWGLVGCLWNYYRAARQPVDLPALGSPFADSTAAQPGAGLQADLVSVQSESFFDVRTLWPGIRPQVLDTFDALRSEALAHGRLHVAAWGANTVRTEFAFLSGIPGDRLGVHRFNPYRLLARQGVPSIARHLKQQGYRTICIHPYDGSFYGRDKVLPALGFDEFIDVRSFNDADKAGPFIGDCAVADKINALLSEPGRTQPLFIHAVTMENHGPLHLEAVSAAELPTWFDRPLAAGLRDLGPYLRHIGNADRMLGKLREHMNTLPRPTALCFYGDHVPILPDVYKALGEPAGDTEYFIWSNQQKGNACASSLPVDALAHAFVTQGQAIARPQQAPYARAI